MRKKKQTEWFRNCPICDKLLIVHTKQQFVRANENNTSCMPCSKKKFAATEEGKKHQALMILKSKEYWNDPFRIKRQDEILKEKQNLTRFCPSCDKILHYKNITNKNKSTINNSLCKSCSNRKSITSKWKDIFYRNNQLKNITQRVSSLRKYKNGSSKIENEVFNKVKKFGFLAQSKIDSFYVDMCCEQYKLIIEINGDFWHANPLFYKSDWVNTVNKKTAQQIWDKDSIRISKLQSLGYDVIVLWENEIKNNLDFISIIESKIDKLSITQNCGSS